MVIGEARAASKQKRVAEMALRCLCFVLLLLIVSANSGKLLQYEINQVLEQLNRDAKGYYQYNDADVVDWGRNVGLYF